MEVYARMLLQPGAGPVCACATIVLFLRISCSVIGALILQATTDFAGEAARLSAALQQREQDLRFTGIAALMTYLKQTVLFILSGFWCLATLFQRSRLKSCVQQL